MKSSVVARNYAEALLTVADQAKAVEKIGELLDAVAGAIASDPSLKAVMMSPRIRKSQKQEMLAKALGSVAPAPFVKFLQAVVQRGRQDLFSEMSQAYQLLADKHFNRVHASVVTARDADEAMRKLVTERLTQAMGKTVLPHFRTDASILGGVIVRLGDRVLDGSIRRRIQTLRARMLNSGR